LKRHEPAAFACALLNSQPMGFYSASQIVQDARRGKAERPGVEVLAVDVAWIGWDCTLEVPRGLAPIRPAGTFPRFAGEGVSRPGAASQVRSQPEAVAQVRGFPSPACGGSAPNGGDGGNLAETRLSLRLGLRMIAGLSETTARAILAARAQMPFHDIPDLCRRAGLDEKSRTALAEAGALQSLAGHRNDVRWAVAGIERQRPLLPGSPDEDAVALPAPSSGEDVLSDYRALGLSLRQHPLALLRGQLRARRLLDSQALRDRGHGSHVAIAGLVTQRQRPQTASGTIFVTLEDEAGMVNVIVWPRVAERGRRALLGSTLLAVRGRWERVDGVDHLVAAHLEDLSPLLGGLRAESRDFR